jgi:vancomycin permeability regulator SanA
VLTSFVLVALLVIGTIGASAVSVWRAAHNDEARFVDDVDAVLVLGAAQYGGRPSPIFRGRLDHAAHLYRNDFSDRILVLGAGQPGEATTEADAGADYLVSHHGIPSGAVTPSPRGRTSLASLEAAADYMRREQLRTALLVSDPWHNARIRVMARDLGIEAYVSATFRSAAVTQRTRLDGYLRETFAYLFYRVFRA